MFTALLRSFLTSSYSLVHSLSWAARLWERLDRSRIMMSLTFISSSASRLLATALAYSRALLSRLPDSSNDSRSSAVCCCDSSASSFCSSLFSRSRNASLEALSFSSDSSCRKSLMKMSISRLRSSSALSCSRFSFACDRIVPGTITSHSLVFFILAFTQLLACLSYRGSLNLVVSTCDARTRLQSSFWKPKLGMMPLTAARLTSALRKSLTVSSFSRCARWWLSVARLCSICRAVE